MTTNKLKTKDFVDAKNYPMYLAGILFGLTAIFMGIAFFVTGELKSLWTVFGIELLLYMLLNAFSCLIVAKIGLYLRRTVLFYVINLLLVVVLIYLYSGKSLTEYRDGFPAFEALIFCFFSSLILISLIRAVVNFFKEEE